jgi:uncharacterized membrane protein YagU involved in acid resistance
MALPSFTRTQAILWGGFAAGFIDLTAIFIIWQVFENIGPIVILQAIATSLMGDAAYQAGNPAALLGLVLHFIVSLCFAAGYVLAADRIDGLKKYPLIFGPLYGIVAYLIMSYIVVPLTLATFGRPDSLFTLARSVLMHMFVFAPWIALAASRVRPSK